MAHDTGYVLPGICFTVTVFTGSAVLAELCTLLSASLDAVHISLYWKQDPDCYCGKTALTGTCNMYIARNGVCYPCTAL